MKYKRLQLLFGILLLILLPIPKYVELNHLILIQSGKIYCTEEQYKITLKEIIPKKEDNGIKYLYKNYQETGTSLKDMKQNLEEKEKKKFYYHGIKTLTTNCQNPKEISDIFQIPIKKIKWLHNSYIKFCMIN